MVPATQLGDVAFGQFKMGTPGFGWYMWPMVCRSIWNDLLFAMTLTNSDSTMPVTAKLNGFISAVQVDYGALMASTLISVLPMLLVFLCFQKAFVRGCWEIALNNSRICRPGGKNRAAAALYTASGFNLGRLPKEVLG